MKILFNDNTEIDVMAINGATRFFQNSQRDSLEFVFAKTDYPFNTLDTYFADKNKTKKIILIDNANNQYVHEDYVIRVSMSLTPVIVTPATSTSPEATEERISVIMAQQTYIEKQLAQLLGT